MKKTLTILAVLIWTSLALNAQQGEIIYIDYEPDSLVELKQYDLYPESKMMIDFDFDSIPDIRITYYAYGAGGYWYDIRSYEPEWELHEYEVGDTLMPMDDPELRWSTRILWERYFYNEIDTISDKFAFRHKVGDSYYYGWFRVYITMCPPSPYPWVALDKMAYCTDPDYPLVWGQTEIPAQPEIIYTDFEPDTCKMITDNHESDFMFDIDHDGIVDMTLFGYTQHGAVLVTIDMSNGFELCRSNENTVLNADTIVWFGSDDLSNGYPLDSYRKSVGFRKTVNGHYFYGWMEVYWDGVFYSEGKMIYVDRIAFCTIPDYPLIWGQTSLDQIGEEGAEWYYEILNDNGSITYQHLECAADTTINGKRPKIIIRSNTQYDKDLHTEVTHEYIYEENGVVYWWNKDLEEFTTLYDLAAEVGDEWEIKVGTESLTMHVDAVENIDYEGRTFRILRVSDENDLFSGNIVCGIGHLTSFFPERLMTRGKGYRVEGMRCYWVDGNLTFKIGDEDCDAIYEEWHNGIEENGLSTGLGTFTVYPNPTDGYLVLETKGIASLQNQTYRITNPLGQTVLSGHISAENQQINIENLSTGMYFITVGNMTQKFIVK